MAELSKNIPGVTGSAITVPVAVFTARLGYDWSTLPGFVRQDVADSTIEEIQGLSHKVAGNLGSGDYVRGVIYRSGIAYVFKFHIAEKWDQAKRDADYCACAFVRKEVLGGIDIAKLFENGYFQEFSRSPAAEIPAPGLTVRSSSMELSGILAKAKAGALSEWNWSSVGQLLADRGDRNADWIFIQYCVGGVLKFHSQFGEWVEPKLSIRPRPAPVAADAGSETVADDSSKSSFELIAECEELKVKVLELQAELEGLRTAEESLKKELATANRTVGIQKTIISKMSGGSSQSQESADGQAQKKGGGKLGYVVAAVIGALLGAAAMLVFIIP